MADLEADGRVTFSLSQEVKTAAAPAATATTSPAKPTRSAAAVATSEGIVSAATANKDGASAATVQHPGRPLPPVASAKLMTSTEEDPLVASIGPNGSDLKEASATIAVAVPTVAPVVAVPVALPTKEALLSKNTTLDAACARQISGAVEATNISSDGDHGGGSGGDGGGGGRGVGDADATSALPALGHDATTVQDQLSAEQITEPSGTGEAGGPLVLTMPLMDAVQEIRRVCRMR